jgi:hypothetical protein
MTGSKCGIFSLRHVRASTDDTERQLRLLRGLAIQRGWHQ